MFRVLTVAMFASTAVTYVHGNVTWKMILFTKTIAAKSVVRKQNSAAKIIINARKNVMKTVNLVKSSVSGLYPVAMK